MSYCKDLKLSAVSDAARERKNPKAQPAVAAADFDKRTGQLAVPLNLRALLSAEQISSVQQMEHFGWHLAFVRRDDAGQPMVVVANGSEKRFALLDLHGAIDSSRAVPVRH